MNSNSLIDLNQSIAQHTYAASAILVAAFSIASGFDDADASGGEASKSCDIVNLEGRLLDFPIRCSVK